MADPSVLTTIVDGVQTLVIAREKARNTLDVATIDALVHGLEQAVANDAVRVVVITGSGSRVFCAGADLSLIQCWTDLSRGGTNPFVGLLQALMRCPKPVVAMVNGAVLGGGVGLMLACDLVVAADDVYVCTPEVHLGLFPFMVYPLLVAHVGRKRASEMALTGRKVPAAEAREMGLLNRVVSRETLRDEVGSLAAELRRGGPAAISLGKEAVGAVLDSALYAHVEEMSAFFARCLGSPEFAEGATAFLQKRDPSWRLPTSGGGGETKP